MKAEFIIALLKEGVCALYLPISGAKQGTGKINVRKQLSNIRSHYWLQCDNLNLPEGKQDVSVVQIAVV